MEPSGPVDYCPWGMLGVICSRSSFGPLANPAPPALCCRVSDASSSIHPALSSHSPSTIPLPSLSVLSAACLPIPRLSCYPLRPHRIVYNINTYPSLDASRDYTSLPFACHGSTFSSSSYAEAAHTGSERQQWLSVCSFIHSHSVYIYANCNP
jgi:hypothetical protein